MPCEESSTGLDDDQASVILVKANTETCTDPAQDVLQSTSYTCSVIPARVGTSLHGDDPFCRICHDGSSAGDLLSPCECAGSLAMVHRVCLEHWLTASGTSHCELCHYHFALEKRRKPLTEWFTAPAVQHQRQTLCGDVICFLFITPLAGLSGWLCVQGAMDLYYSNGIEAIGLIILTMTLFTIYLFWTVDVECNECQRPTPDSSSNKDPPETNTCSDALSVQKQEEDGDVVPVTAFKDNGLLVFLLDTPSFEVTP